MFVVKIFWINKETFYLCGSIFKQKNKMIIVPVKEGENIERSLKKFKRKFEKTGVIRELRTRQAFIKPSVRRREEVKKAIYVQQLQKEEE